MALADRSRNGSGRGFSRLKGKVKSRLRNCCHRPASVHRCPPGGRSERKDEAMVSVRLAALAGAALIIGAQAAGAADMAPILKAPPPAPVFGGWYLRGDIGFSNEDVGHITFVDVDGTVPTQQNLSKGFDSA